MSSQRDGQAWEVRAARNQAVFRAINEELRASGENGESILTIACECADVGCVETLDVEAERYAEIRRENRRFIVLAGHVYPEVERVVARDGGIEIVEKLGAAGEVADAAVAFQSTA